MVLSLFEVLNVEKKFRSLLWTRKVWNEFLPWRLQPWKFYEHVRNKSQYSYVGFLTNSYLEKFPLFSFHLIGVLFQIGRYSSFFRWVKIILDAVIKFSIQHWWKTSVLLILLLYIIFLFHRNLFQTKCLV